MSPSEAELFVKFPELSEETKAKLLHFAALLKETNAKVNLVSRKDEDNIAYRHVIFCLAITKFLTPNAGAKIVDVGTGGGLPGVVMAIAWPQAKIFMLDGVGKKIAALADMIKELKLPNALAKNARIEQTKDLYDYATGRSVIALPEFLNFVGRNLKEGKNGTLSNGVIYFKGGDLEQELASKSIFPANELKLDEFFDDTAYEGKRLVHFTYPFKSRNCR